MPTIKTGPRGGRYYIKNGNKIYLTNSTEKDYPMKVSGNKSCKPGNKKFAKIVNGKCVRFGDRNMTIKKNIPSRKKSFCARHKCKEKCDQATPGYQSCKKWECITCK